MSESHQSPHRHILVRSLPSLGIDPHGVFGYEVLSGGASGAYTYRLRVPTGDVVLKVTSPESPGHLLERARRELLFYRHLASRVRVRVPEMIASRDESAVGVCLLLRAYEPAPVPAAWSKTLFVEAAEQLGRFHAAFWGKKRELSPIGWLRRDRGPVAVDIHQASAHWERLRADRRFDAILTPSTYVWVLGLLERLGDVASDPSPFPTTLCHGDFHADNICIGPGGGLVFADWQEVGAGHGPEDLSFFIQRATFSGGTVPVADMFATYRRSLVVNAGEDVSEQDIRRIADAAELRTRLLHWPAYLMGAPEDRLTDVLDRIRSLSITLLEQPW